ncbi:cryptochrome/photolyase family protein [Spirillospora sp. CA-108201]
MAHDRKARDHSETGFHWLFGDQLGPHFLRPDAEIVMIESRAVLRRRRFHRAKAHLVLSAMRRRAAELGDRVRYVKAETYRDGLERAVGDAPVTVHHPTSHAALRFVQGLRQVEVLEPRGFLVRPDAFGRWAESAGGGRLRMESFYRQVRQDHDLLMDGDQPAGGRWNLDGDNRESPPEDEATLPVPAPYRPREDEIDERVRDDLDRWERSGDVSFVGRDGPRRFPACRAEAAEAAYRAGDAPLNSVEGYVRQVAGWREDDPGQPRPPARLGPPAVTDWFHRCFVDGYDWVMLTNVIGMSQYADGGRITTKPYASGGAYIDTMSDLCGPCAYRPAERTGERACPYTAGYWEFVHRHRERLSHNHRTARAVKQLERLGDLDEVLADVRRRDPHAAP